MTNPIQVGTRRLAVSGDRVTCWRLGQVVLDRCRECAYLMRLESAKAHGLPAAFVVCAGDRPGPEQDFAW
jgi:hypothetical protein